MIFLLFTKKTSKAYIVKLDKHIPRVGMHRSHIKIKMKEEEEEEE